MQTLRVLAVLTIVGIGIIAYALWGRSGREASMASAAPTPVIPISRLTELRPVKDIELQYHQPGLPPGPHQQLFATQCVICHSPRYVLNQPVFPRKTWAVEVHKMAKAYGAPITPDQEPLLVDYLVSWHGKEDAPAAPTQNTK